MEISVLIPTCNRIDALIATLTALTAQTFRNFEVIVADQSESFASEHGVVRTLVRILQLHGNPVKLLSNLPKRGMAHQRQFLLDQSNSPYSLFLDDDIILEPEVMERMHRALKEEQAGFCGMAAIGLSYLNDVRPDQQHIEFWENQVTPEVIYPGSKEWFRYPLHNAANIFHVSDRLKIGIENQRKYKVAWVGGCILYDTAKLKETGGFNFWEQLPPEHCGEDVLAQLRLMKMYGGFGLIPSGAYHLELPTTLVNREVNAPEYLL